MQIWGRHRMRRRGVAAAVTALAGLGPTVGGAQDSGGLPPGQAMQVVKAGLERELLAVGRFYTSWTDRHGYKVYTAHDIERVALTACRLRVTTRSRAYQPAPDTSTAKVLFPFRAVAVQTIAMADVDPDSIRSWQEPPAAGGVLTLIEVRRQVYVHLQTAPGRSDAFHTATNGRPRSHRVTDLPVPDPRRPPVPPGSSGRRFSCAARQVPSFCSDEAMKVRPPTANRCDTGQPAWGRG